MLEQDATSVISEETEKKVLEDKKKLLEIYIIISGLIIASIQSTSTLIAINTSINEVAYKETILFTKATIGTSNLVFLLLVFLILIYYTKTFDENLVFTTFLVILISIFFSYILTNFVHLQTRLSLVSYFTLFALIFAAMFLSLVQNSILRIELNKIFNNRDFYPQTMLKIHNLVSYLWKLSLLLIIIFVLYYLSIPILYWAK